MIISINALRCFEQDSIKAITEHKRNSQPLHEWSTNTSLHVYRKVREMISKLFDAHILKYAVTVC